MRPLGVLPTLGLGAGGYLFCFGVLGHRAGIHPSSDDFGYLRSILGALERGGPYTYEWLAPYSAVFTGAAAFLTGLTGDLPLSVRGILAVSSLAAFALLFRLLAARVPPGRAALLAFLFAASPTFLAKATDIHGCIPTLAIFLLALVCHEERRDGLFFLAAFLAFANRQNGVALLVLPMLQGLATLARGRIPWRLTAYAALFGLAAAGLRLLLNRTYAQDLVFASADAASTLRAAVPAFLAGAGILLGLLALFGLLGWPARSPYGLLVANLRRPARPAAATALILLAAWLWPPFLVVPDLPVFGAVGLPALNRGLSLILLSAPWFLDWRLLRPSPFLALALVYLALGSLRGIWYDYYFLEIGVLALLLAAEPGSGGETGHSPSGSPAFGRALLGILLSACLGYAYLLKVNADRVSLAVTHLERLERKGAVAVDQMSNAPFGYLGWKLFDHYLVHDAGVRAPLAGFQSYVRRDRVHVETTLPWRREFKTALPTGASLLEEGACRVGYLPARYRVVDRHGPDTSGSILGALVELEYAAYAPRPYPLDRREWRALADSSRDRSREGGR